MLQGFSEFFHNNNRIPLASGLTEIERLSKSHFILARLLSQNETNDYFNGQEGFRHVLENEVVDISKLKTIISKLKNEQEIVIGMIPKRWFAKRDINEGPIEAINRLLPWGESNKMPPNYVWGIATKWDDNQENYSQPAFVRNKQYHAHDGLLESWKKGNPAQKAQERLDKPTPRAFAPFSLQQGHTFHPYSDKTNF